ncbi:Serine carboxypeptidase-like 38 [Platanthera guangdongensis]|uniref:Serine carboxypeptidase-like 38 n=1 Tax=Platanthera guangdongensis TaxID=2320717 RepID=A0ABR2MM82_9ASPA
MEAKSLLLTLFLVLAAASALPATTSGDIDEQALERDEDFIDELPNQPDSPDFRQYSGYVQVEPVYKRRYFYYFVEAEVAQPTSRPLILYIGTHEREIVGSPLLAAFQEVGPYTVDMDGQTLLSNPFSWNKLANLLFAEGPAGLDFSTSNNDQDVFHTFQFAFIAELYHFIAQWMKKFPEHKNNDVYIAGIGDIGAYGPALATYILYENSKPASTPINIRGIMMGNPGMDTDQEFLARIETGYRMNTLSEELYREYKRVCTDVKTIDYGACWGPLGNAETIRFAIDNNNNYGKICPGVDPESVSVNNFMSVVYGCFDQSVAGYMNIPFVQATLHAERNSWGPTLWTPTAILQEESVIPIEMTIKNMSFTVSSEWRPWFDRTAQVAGFTESYAEGLTYATVRGAGQKAMADQPERTFVMIKSFLANSSLPSSQYV